MKIKKREFWGLQMKTSGWLATFNSRSQLKIPNPRLSLMKHGSRP